MLQARVKLIVTGDDFGYCPRRNQGIVECFLAGAVSNVSLMVNGSAAPAAAQLARRHNIPIGLHANLSEGSPVCTALKKNSSLLNKDGFFHGKMGFRTVLAKGLLKMSEVKQELTAQVDLFRELTGHVPHHMDGHQHVHVLPEVRHVFAQVLEEYGIKYTRVPIELGLHSCAWIEPPLMDFYLGVEKDSLDTVDVFTRHGIRWADIYIGLSTMGKNMSVSNIQSAIDTAVAAFATKENSLTTQFSPQRQQGRTVTIELMVHPGYPTIPPVGGCGEGPDDFSQSWERLHELQTLMNPELQSYYKTRNIQLCAFKDL
ncbi:carbohydrate deacetylase [Trachemys scripta elegans]|uniref:carbohydrate deacetylase n=1 Tax=Trachemys scripta elegans TaxID=31138 RepID=UPI001554B103|nr:carbohydrate deacetylase [Trachemys scripta elegans]XP_034646901.1 carbohydrate deacetylase [Trachemys scripta elegans]XP_034646902.1 carbohydrate deacetylase [Trachemys scripta elegans]XP_034646903.1 carbohydrate deacetylase [Trachemys scripta elegans]XP_034646904.1 carbohydrate deacetylase [Trachemys scripta elegans]